MKRLQSKVRPQGEKVLEEAQEASPLRYVGCRNQHVEAVEAVRSSGQLMKWGLLSWLKHVGCTVLWYQLEGG